MRENKPIKMLTIKEAAALFDGLTEYRIRQMCISGDLPCVRAGKKYLICEPVLLQYICSPEGKQPACQPYPAGITPIPKNL